VTASNSAAQATVAQRTVVGLDFHTPPLVLGA